jgi:diguanylate cyclase (GGDEF)-like protein
MSDLQAENKKLKKSLAVLTSEAEKNHSIRARSQARELDLLRAESLPDLMDKMIVGLANSYGLSNVTLLLCDPHHEIRHLLMDATDQHEDPTDVIYVDSLTGLAPQFTSLSRPWLGPYNAADHQLVFPGASHLKSVALLPLIRQNRLMGSLNFGSTDEARYTPMHGTEVLAHLATIASFSLENMVNRARLVRSGLTDVLTGWHNRRYLQDRLREELARARRDRLSLCCLMLDVDHFKRINDKFGHLAGDKTLREIAQRVESQTRSSDMAARYGGEEFVLLLPATQINDAIDLANRIREAVSKTPIAVGAHDAVTITVSIGISVCLPDEYEQDLKTVAEALLAAADVAMYKAKSAGRDCVRTADDP